MLRATPDSCVCVHRAEVLAFSSFLSCSSSVQSTTALRVHVFMDPAETFAAASQYLDGEAAGTRVLAGVANLLERAALATRAAAPGGGASLLRGLGDFDDLPQRLLVQLLAALTKQLAKMDTVLEVLRGCVTAVDKGRALAAAPGGARRPAGAAAAASPRGAATGPGSDSASVACEAAYAASPRQPASCAEVDAAAVRIAGVLRADCARKAAAWEGFAAGLTQGSDEGGSGRAYGALFELLVPGGDAADRARREAQLAAVSSALASLAERWPAAGEALAATGSETSASCGHGWQALPALHAKLTGRAWAAAAAARS